MLLYQQKPPHWLILAQFLLGGVYMLILFTVERPNGTTFQQLMDVDDFDDDFFFVDCECGAICLNVKAVCNYYFGSGYKIVNARFFNR